MFKSQEYQITHIVDRVGGGDSFMGALIYGLIHYPENDQKALDYAVRFLSKAYHQRRRQPGNDSGN